PSRSPAAPRALHSFPTRRSSDLSRYSFHVPTVAPLAGSVDRNIRVPKQKAPRRVAPLAGSVDRNLNCRDLRFCKLLSLPSRGARSEEHTSELQSRFDLVCRLLLE